MWCGGVCVCVGGGERGTEMREKDMQDYFTLFSFVLRMQCFCN